MSVPSHTSGRFLIGLAVPYAAIWTALAFDPNDRHDWLLENALTVLGLALLAATWRVFPLKRLSYVLIAVFLTLHTLGAHYTYAEVPYDQWTRTAFGFSLNE